jgi:hypothetical protein
MFRRSLCARFVQRGLCGIGAVAAASPAVGTCAVFRGVQQQQSRQQAPRFELAVVPRVALALRHCTSSSSASSSSSSSGVAPVAGNVLLGAAAQPPAERISTGTELMGAMFAVAHWWDAVVHGTDKHGNKKPKLSAEAVRLQAERAEAEAEAERIHAMRAFVTWWDAVVFNMEEDGGARAKAIKFSFSGSIDELCESLRVADSAAGPEFAEKVYVALMQHMRREFTETHMLLAAREALATALATSPDDVARRRAAVINWVGDVIVGFKYESWRVFSSFPSTPMLQNNKHVAAALDNAGENTPRSALNRMLDAVRELRSAVVKDEAVVKFSFTSSVSRFGVHDPDQIRRNAASDYTSFISNVRHSQAAELDKLASARMALAAALQSGEPDVARQRRGDVLASLRRLLHDESDHRAAFHGFPEVSMLQDNKHVVVALHDDTSPLNQMLDALALPLGYVAALLHRLDAKRSLYIEPKAMPVGPHEFPAQRIWREIVNGELGPKPPVIISRLADDGSFDVPGDGGVDDARLTLFVGEAGTGKTLAAMQYALSKPARDTEPDARGKRVGIRFVAHEIFWSSYWRFHERWDSALAEMPEASRTPEALQALASDLVVERLCQYLLQEAIALPNLLSSRSVVLERAVVGDTVKLCRRACSAGADSVPPPLFAPSVKDACVTIIVDDVRESLSKQVLLGLVAVASRLSRVLAAVLNVATVRIVAAGSGADSVLVTAGVSPDQYRLVRCAGQREYWDAFEAKKKWNLGLTEDARRLLENPCIAALFAEGLDKALARRGETAGPADADTMRMLAMQSLPLALREFPRWQGLGRLKSPATGLLHALFYADSGTVATVPPHQREPEDLVKDKKSFIERAHSALYHCCANYGVLVDRATVAAALDSCIAAKKPFAEVFEAVTRDPDAIGGKLYVNLPSDGAPRFAMPPAMLQAALFHISDRLQRGASALGAAAAGPSLEQDVFDALTLRALAPPLDARFCDFSCVTLLRHISSGLGNAPVVGNVHRAFVLRECAFPIQYLRDVKQLAEKVKCVSPSASKWRTAPDEITVRNALRKKKDAIVMRNGPGAAFAHMLVLAPNKLVLVICDSFDSTTTVEHDVEEAFGKLGWPRGRRNWKWTVQRRTTKALVELCRAGRKSYGNVTPVDFTVELVYVFSGGSLADQDAARPFVTHGPYPFPTKAVQEAGGAAAGHDKGGWAMRDPADSSILYRRWIVHSGDDVRAAASREQYIAAREHYLKSTPDTAEFKDRRDALFECSKQLHALFPLTCSAPHNNNDNRKTDEAMKTLTTHADATTVDMQQQAHNNEDWLAFSPIAGAPTLDVKTH